jgi:hypothetical protein
MARSNIKHAIAQQVLLALYHPTKPTHAQATPDPALL